MELTQAIDLTPPANEHWMAATHQVGVVAPTVAPSMTVVARLHFTHTNSSRQADRFVHIDEVVQALALVRAGFVDAPCSW